MTKRHRSRNLLIQGKWADALRPQVLEEDKLETAPGIQPVVLVYVKDQSARLWGKFLSFCAHEGLEYKCVDPTHGCYEVWGDMDPIRRLLRKSFVKRWERALTKRAPFRPLTEARPARKGHIDNPADIGLGDLPTLALHRLPEAQRTNVVKVTRLAFGRESDTFLIWLVGCRCPLRWSKTEERWIEERI